MPTMTGSRFFAEAMRGNRVSHVFLVPTIILPALAEMEDLDIRRVTTHGEKRRAPAGGLYGPERRRGQPGSQTARRVPGLLTRHRHNRRSRPRDALWPHLPGSRRLPDVRPCHEAQSAGRRRQTVAGSAAADVSNGYVGSARASPPTAQGPSRRRGRRRGRPGPGRRGTIHLLPGLSARAGPGPSG